MAMLAASVVLTLFASREFDEGRWTRWDYALFIALIAIAILVAALQVLRDTGQRSLRKDLDALLVEARVKMRTDFGDALDTAIEEIGRLAVAREPQRSEIYGGVVRLLLSAACELTGPGEGRMRATFFEYRAATQTDAEGLYAYASVGRSGSSSFNFEAGTGIGDEALRMVKRREFLLESNVHNEPPASWTKGTPAQYEAFLSVACAIKREAIGMLSVDSTRSADLDEDDVAMLTLIGRILVVAYRLKASVTEQ